VVEGNWGLGFRYDWGNRGFVIRERERGTDLAGPDFLEGDEVSDNHPGERWAFGP